MEDSPSPARRALWVGLAVIGIVAVAFFLRSYWNLEAAHPDDSTFVLSGGSDPYYHKRAIDCIVFGDVNGDCAGNKPWTHFLNDPLLNYPFGSINPNPPLHQWSVAVFGAALDPVTSGGLREAVWWSTIYMPAVWGALTVIPIYFLGAELFSRKAGLIAAFFWAVGTTAIDHTALGDADHDAILMFFSVTAMLFYVKMLNAFRGNETWVVSWGDGSSISAGVRRLWAERAHGFGYAGLSGVAIAAVALTWKGFPYLLGIILVFAGIILLIDNWKNRDSLGVFLGTTLVFLLSLGLAYPYYAAANLMAANFYAPLSMLVAWLVAAAILVPTRDLPFILILPGSIVAGALGAVAIYFLSPTAWRSLFNATVYFRQSQLYQTIAEAHPADFNSMVFGIGPVVFLLAIVGIGWVAWGLRKDGRRAQVFLLIWAVVALYMAQSAVRFLFNAVPVLALVAGGFTARILDWVNFGSARREFAGAGSVWGGIRRGVRPGHVVAAVLLAVVLVLPQVVLAFDAAVPFQVENRWQRERLEEWLIGNGFDSTNVTGKPIEGSGGLREMYVKKRLEQEDLEDTSENRQDISREFIFFVERRMGAFGQGFLDTSWQRGLTFLDKYSNENWTGPVPQRPAFLAWWDYGHWAISVGKVPAVADNFQNGYQFAANFLLAQNETHAVQLLAARLLPCVPACRAGEINAQLTVVRNVLPNATEQDVRDLLDWKYVRMSEDDAVRLAMAAEAATGKKIRYFTVDGRMMPLDDPNTPTFIDRASIFYAPVILKGEDPEKYLTTKYTATGCRGTELTSKQLDECVRNPAFSAQVSVTGQKLEYTRAFVNTMFYRGFVGTQPTQTTAVITADAVVQAFLSAQPGLGLKHFRAIYADSDVRILEFYPGVNVTGRLVDDSTPPLPVAGATVRVFDDLNHRTPAVAHGETTTRADGTWSIIAPFSTGPGTTIEIVKDNVKVANRTLQISHTTARALLDGGVYASTPVGDVTVAKGSINGTVFFDADLDGTKDANESALANFAFKIGASSVTTNAEGKYSTSTVAGEAAVSTDNATYTFRSGARVRIEPGKDTSQNIGAILRPTNVTGVVTLENKPGKNFTSPPYPLLSFVADSNVTGNTARNATVNIVSNGTYRISLTPGTYTVKLGSAFTYRESIDDPGTPYTLADVLFVPQATVSITKNFELKESAPGA